MAKGEYAKLGVTYLHSRTLVYIHTVSSCLYISSIFFSIIGMALLIVKATLKPPFVVEQYVCVSIM